jgi:hypothetical protein
MTPPVYMAFDCPYGGRAGSAAAPLARQREALDETIDGATLVLPAHRLPPHGLAVGS